MPQISVVIIAWNAERYLRDCLESILKSMVDFTYEIILVNNGSTDNTSGIMEDYRSQENFRLITLPANLGVAGGRNQGLRRAQGKYIWFLDVDTVVNREAVEGMMAYMESHPDCGICGCKLINGRGEVQDSCRRLPSVSYKVNNVVSVLLGRFAFLQSLKEKVDRKNQSQFYREKIQGIEPFEVEYLIGACQFIRREVTEQTGELDEKIFYGPEDADYCLRISLKNWKIVYLPSIRFFHDYQRVTNRKLISKMGWLHAKALFYFFRKYKRF